MRGGAHDAGRPEDQGLRTHLTVIDRVTGHKPPTCPWRSFYEPCVIEVLSVSWAVEDGNLGAVMGADPPFALAQALAVYTRARRATEADERKLLAEEEKAKQRAIQLRNRLG